MEYKVPNLVCGGETQTNVWGVRIVDDFFEIAGKICLGIGLRTKVWYRNHQQAEISFYDKFNVYR